MNHNNDGQWRSLPTITLIGGGAWLVGSGSGLLVGYNAALDGVSIFADAAPWIIVVGIAFLVIGGVRWWRK